MFEVGIKSAKEELEKIKREFQDAQGDLSKLLKVKVSIEGIDTITRALSQIGDTTALRNLRSEVEALNKEFVILSKGAGGEGSIASRGIQQQIEQTRQSLERYNQQLKDLTEQRTKLVGGKMNKNYGNLTTDMEQTQMRIDGANSAIKRLEEQLANLGSSTRASVAPVDEAILQLKQHIDALKAQGAHIFYQVDAKTLQTAAKPEPIKTECGLKAIRRRNTTGYHYFMANLSPNDIHSIEPLAVDFKDAVWFNPLDGSITKAQFDKDGLVINLRSGESRILQTYDKEAHQQTHPQPLPAGRGEVTLKAEIQLGASDRTPWTLSFVEEAPKVDKTFQLTELQTWERLDDANARVTMGTGVYTTHLKLTKKDLRGVNGWMIDLGDVRESARVYINGQLIGCAWSVPFVLDCGQALKVGDNEIRIEVTNLPANRIADLDRRGVKWRKMEEINVVDINYKKTLYDQWESVPSGLNSEVKLIRY